MRRIAIYGVGFLAINSIYLVLFPSATVFYMANAVLHLVVGLVLMGAALVWARRHWQMSTAILLAGLPAVYLVIRGNTLDHRMALISHILLALAAVSIVEI